MAEIILDHTTGSLLPRVPEAEIALLPDCSAASRRATVAASNDARHDELRTTNDERRT
jgi:hypothetical protein